MTPQVAQRWLDDHATKLLPHSSAALVLLPAGVACWPALTAEGPPLEAAAKAALERGQAVFARLRTQDKSGIARRVLAVPVHSGGRRLGALSLALHSDDATRTADTALLQSAHAAVHVLATALSAPEPLPRDLAADALQLLAVVLDGSRPLEQAGAALAGDLARRLGFDRVSIGLIGRSGVDVVAVSHAAEVDTQRSLLRTIAAAMEEAVDQAVSIVYPPSAQALPRIVVAHAALAGRGPGAVLTVPLVSAGACIGALCLERAGAAGAQEVARAETLASALAPPLALRRRAEQPLSTRLGEALGAHWKSLRSWRALVPAGGALVLALGSLLPIGYRVGAPARIEGVVQRSVAAPTDGFLQAVHVRPGDTAKAGALLLEMADEELRLERQKLEAELAQHDSSSAAALAQDDRAQFAVAHAKSQETLARLELVRAQLQRGRLVAPIDGIVIGGDLTQALGAPVQRGQVLLTLATDEGHRLVIEVDERDIAALRPGQRGELALAAIPDHRFGFHVRRITPVAVVAQGRNAFEVLAEFDATAASAPLRPGLQGVAKIEAGERSLWWIATHRFTDSLRLFWLRWGP